MFNLETKLKVIKDYKGGVKSVVVIAPKLGMSNSTITTNLKSKNKMMEGI